MRKPWKMGLLSAAFLGAVIGASNIAHKAITIGKDSTIQKLPQSILMTKSLSYGENLTRLKRKTIH